MKNLFLKAIHEKWLLKIRYDSTSKGVIERICVPFDFGPSRRSRNNVDKYHFYDLDSPDGKHVLSVLPERVLDMKLLDKHFDPAIYVTWDNIEWYVPRDWGAKS